MALPVYSIQMYANNLNGGASVTVPAGVKWVVRDIDVSYVTSSSTRADLYVVMTGVIVWYQALETMSLPGVSAAWRGRQVIDPGDTLQFITSELLGIKVSGYALTLP